jgi:hypothetical protein
MTFVTFPSVGDYNHHISKYGGELFRTLYGIDFVPSNNFPLKFYVFGSGAYAAVFKGNFANKYYAIRCLYTADNEILNRIKLICDYLQIVKPTWCVNCALLENEFLINGHSYPIIKMDWIEGLQINEFVKKNLNNNYVLSEIQKQLVLLSNDLEHFQIGHGDIQSGNILIVGNSDKFELKLVDYDGMFVPQLSGKLSTEKGRSEFQHPKRENFHFNHLIDRFSIWVMITAIEAVKENKTLWLEVMQGGFNTGDNFLFTINDFLNPNSSDLFKRIDSIDKPALKFYVANLRDAIQSEFNGINKPLLFNGEDTFYTPSNSDKLIGEDFDNQCVQSVLFSLCPDGYMITSNFGEIFILTSSFQRIGTTPIVLIREQYVGRHILISNGKETKKVNLKDFSISFKIELNY